MPYLVKHLIENQHNLITTNKDDLVKTALTQMIEHDFSQLPVVDTDDFPLGMVTYEGILRGVRNFKVKIDELHVRDVMTDAPIFNLEDDLFDLLDKLKLTNAALIVEPYQGHLIGIVTSYDTSSYFRERTEDLMLVEEIETTIKDLIRIAYIDDQENLQKTKLADAISKILPPARAGDEKPIDFSELALNEYINLLLYGETWKVLEPILGIPRIAIRELLNGVRITRNDLAHFRNEISTEQHDQLKFCSEWITRCMEEYQKKRDKEMVAKLFAQIKEPENLPNKVIEVISPSTNQQAQVISSSDQPDIFIQSGEKDSRYSPLADWLQSQPGKNDQVRLSFDEIEAIIGGELPSSARGYRAWWANDSVGHVQSQQWLEAGWRTTTINVTEGKVIFSRIKEREKAYIDFYSKQMTLLKKKADFPVRDSSPDGTNWIIISNISVGGPVLGIFVFSFARDQRYRVELYIDTYDQIKTKQVFDLLYAQKTEIEVELGLVSWERLDSKRASRLAIYHPGQITDPPKTLEALRQWGADTMVQFYKSLAPRVEKALREVMQH